MKSKTRPRGRREAGFALPALLFLILVLLIAGMGFFSVATYETKGAIYRQGSNEAFYLADAAVERARARFLADRSWRDGWAGIATGRGTYDMTVRDTAWGGESDVVQLLATGHVANATRKVEVMAQVPPTALGLSVLVMGDAEVGGNLCLGGDAHVNGDAGGNNGNGDPHFECEGDYTEGWVITPPPIYTDPDHFPGDTYYYVKGTQAGSDYTARIFDALGNDITGATDMRNVTTYNPSTKTYTFAFDNAAKITQYFDPATGAFSKLAGTNNVVVNFGEIPEGPSGALYSSVILDGNSSSNIHATVINTRFTGSTEADRLNTEYWEGAVCELRQITMEPYNGIALIAYNMDKPGSSQATIGTPTWPALVYITHDVDTINSNFNLTGSIIVLNDFRTTGGPNITYNSGFIENLPDYLIEDWPDGVSGTLKVLRWREVASATN
jgi:hypothetical protein